jgi:hypothetical protein
MRFIGWVDGTGPFYSIPPTNRKALRFVPGASAEEAVNTAKTSSDPINTACRGQFGHERKTRRISKNDPE